MLYSVLLPALGMSLASLAAVGDTFYRYLLVMVGFTVIIAIHELGHFLVARACNVKCEVYSIGIGPRMLGWKKGVGFSFGPEPTAERPGERGQGSEEGATNERPDPEQFAGVASAGDIHQTNQDVRGETDYRLSWLPLGGYVKMLGQDDMDPTQLSSDPRSFNRRPIWQRMCIISAGVIMNVILAFVLFAVTFRMGIEFMAPDIGPVEVGSPAASAGFEMGDKVVRINGQAPRYGNFEFTDVAIASMLASRGEPVRYTVAQPDGAEKTLSVVPTMDKTTGMQRIGVMPMPSLKVPPLKKAEIEALAEVDPALGQLRDGDEIVAANGQKVTSYPELQRVIQQSDGQPVTLTLANTHKGVGEHTVTLKPKLSQKMGVDGPVTVAGMLPQVQVDQVVPGSPAEAAGLKAGDTIVRAEAMAWPSFEQFQKIVEQNEDEPISVEVLRDGKRLTMQVTPKKTPGGVQVGVSVLPFTGPARVADVTPGTPAADAGLAPGATITAVNDQPVQEWSQAVAALWKVPAGATASITAQNADGATVTVHAPADQLAAVKGLQFQLGVPLTNLMQLQKADSVPAAVWMGLDHTQKFIVQTYMTLRGLFQRTVSPSNLHGIVGIAKIGADAQERGFMWLLYIMGLVSVNLAVVNFLPLPIVDGGLFVLLIIEKIRGKPLEAKVLSAINIAGLALLGCVFLFVTFNDITMFWMK